MIKRYSFNCFGWKEENEKGDFVLYTDYDNMESTLNFTIDSLTNIIKNQAKEIFELKKVIGKQEKEITRLGEVIGELGQDLESTQEAYDSLNFGLLG